MDIVVRTHVKNQQRLDLLERTLHSIHDKGIHELGPVYVLDDNSPWSDQIIELAGNNYATYIRAKNSPGSTKNGLGETLEIGDMSRPILGLCDDIVFGKGSRGLLQDHIDFGIPLLQQMSLPWGMISLFACYARGKMQGETRFWVYPIPAFYAGVAVIYSPKFRKTYVDLWGKMFRGEIPMNPHQDDFLCKDVLWESGTLLLGVDKDLVQHTGIDARTFGDRPDDIGTRYQSRFFIGE